MVSEHCIPGGTQATDFSWLDWMLTISVGGIAFGVNYTLSLQSRKGAFPLSPFLEPLSVWDTEAARSSVLGKPRFRTAYVLS